MNVTPHMPVRDDSARERLALQQAASASDRGFRALTHREPSKIAGALPPKVVKAYRKFRRLVAG